MVSKPQSFADSGSVSDHSNYPFDSIRYHLRVLDNVGQRWYLYIALPARVSEKAFRRVVETHAGRVIEDATFVARFSTLDAAKDCGRAIASITRPRHGSELNQMVSFHWFNRHRLSFS